MPENENLLLRLHQSIDGYSRTQQTLGEFVLSNQADIVYLTITELAHESGTSEASVTRLHRTLGCKFCVLQFALPSATDPADNPIPQISNNSIIRLHSSLPG